MLLENMPDEKRIAIGFNVKVEEEAEELAKTMNIKMILSKVIYHIIEEYEEYFKDLLLELNAVDMIAAIKKDYENIGDTNDN